MAFHEGCTNLYPPLTVFQVFLSSVFLPTLAVFCPFDKSSLQMGGDSSWCGLSQPLIEMLSIFHGQAPVDHSHVFSCSDPLPIFIELFVSLLLSGLSYSYILHVSSLLEIRFTNIFFPPLGCLSALLMIFFAVGFSFI